MIIRFASFAFVLIFSLCALQLAASGYFGPAAIAYADDDGDNDDDDDRGDDDDDDDRQRFSRQSAIQHEILAVGLSPADGGRLRQEGYDIVGESNSALLGVTVSRLKAPGRLGADAALHRARAIAPGTEFARNDIFSRTRARYRAAGEGCGTRCETFTLTAWSPLAKDCPLGTVLGVIDTGVDMSHDSLKGANVTVRTLRSADRAASRLDHGTAVVSLLVGSPTSPVAGVVPGIRILAADAFHKARGGESADAYDLVGALDWLVAERAGVINLSLSGPDNPILKKAIEQTVARRIVIVAAAGRSGENAGYPARYEGVAAISAVDLKLRPSRLSARGDHIDFAAPGVGINAAAPGNRTRLVDGTSFAAPFVAAAFAMSAGKATPSRESEQKLSASARDLGAPGKDPIYGWGLIQYDMMHQCQS